MPQMISTYVRSTSASIPPGQVTRNAAMSTRPLPVAPTRQASDNRGSSASKGSSDESGVTLRPAIVQESPTFLRRSNAVHIDGDDKRFFVGPRRPRDNFSKGIGHKQPPQKRRSPSRPTRLTAAVKIPFSEACARIASSHRRAEKGSSRLSSLNQPIAVG